MGLQYPGRDYSNDDGIHILGSATLFSSWFIQFSFIASSHVDGKYLYFRILAKLRVLFIGRVLLSSIWLGSVHGTTAGDCCIWYPLCSFWCSEPWALVLISVFSFAKCGLQTYYGDEMPPLGAFDEPHWGQAAIDVQGGGGTGTHDQT